MRTLPIPAVALILFIAGCAANPSLPPASEVISTSEKLLADAKARLATMPPDDPGRFKVAAGIADLEKNLGDFKAKVAAEIARDVDPDEAQAQATVQTVSGFLPPPWNALAQVLGGVIVGGVYGLRQRQQKAKVLASAEALAVGIQTVAGQNAGVIDFNDEATRDQLKGAMPDNAKALVKGAQATVPRQRAAAKAKAKPRKTTPAPAPPTP